MTRKLYLLATLVALATVCFAQNSELPAYIKKGRIFTTDGKKVVFSQFKTSGDELKYRSTYQNEARTLPLGEVIRIEEQIGTEAGKWALWFGVSGLAGSLIGTWMAKSNAESQGFDTSDVDTAPIVLGFTAGSALLGATIGSGKKKYKPIYENPQYGSNIPQPSLRLGITCLPGRAYGAGLSLQF